MAKKYITQDTLKKKTLADIFIFIINKKQTTRREIEYETGFSWGTISSNVAFLIEKGYVVEKKSVQNARVGRTTYILEPSGDRIVGIGLDINRSGFSCEVVTLDSKPLKTFRAEFRAKTLSEVISQAENLCQTVLDWCEENSLRVFSLGIAMQGSVNGRLGLSWRFPGVPDGQAFNTKEHFSKKFNLPVYLGHDPKVMLLGEMHKKKSDNCILVRVDEGIGMAVSLDGKIIDDTDRLELGHTIAVSGGKKCRCGKRGCLEAYSSLSSEDFEDNPSAAGEYLSTALYNMYVLFRPQKVIFTGKCARFDDFAKSALSKLLAQDVEILIDSNVSAAFGAAVEAIKSAIRDYVI